MFKFNVIAFSLLSLFLYSCNSVSGPKYDLKGFITESVGGGATSALYKDQNNWPLSKGHVINGVRTGMWTTYHENTTKIQTLTNYVNGKKNGIEITMSERGQIETFAEYRNDALHGLSANYKNGRTLNETSYAKGIMDGHFAIFDESNGKIQKSGSFKNGKQHGDLYFYDGNGNVTLHYKYEDGEKISGGIVE